jgi:dihydrofolate synthase / folylpolyglutamate synthase
VTPDPEFDLTIARLNSLSREPIIPAGHAGLDRAASLLSQVGDPHRRFRSVHVAGSSGKGSTTTMIGSVLQSSGLSTGYFFSPHLSSYNERIVVNGQTIRGEEWVRHMSVLWPVVERMRANSFPGYNLGRPSHSEILFALMAMHFAEKNVSWAAVEAGLGGRLDATNLLESDVAVITNVTLEHTQILGDSVEKIAAEKAAIIKPGSHAVTAAHDKRALDVIERFASSAGAPLLRVGRDVSVDVVEEGLSGQDIQLASSGDSLRVHLNVVGRFQAENAATAFGAIVSLRNRGLPLDDDSLMVGLDQARVPGRMEVISTDPLVVLDGAHNPAAAHELCVALSELRPGQRWKIVFGAMADKDLSEMARALSRLTDDVVATAAPDTDRAAPPETIARAFEQAGCSVSVEDDADRALRQIIQRSAQGDAVLVTGSLYLVGHARRVVSEALAPA